MPKRVILTIDVEQDCPPYLSTTDGMKQGMPKLLDLFKNEHVSATFFTTGEMAMQFPDLMTRMVNEGHEIGCHGHTHRKLSELSYEEADWEISESIKILRQYANVTSFRAPYLSFPNDYLSILIKQGFLLDSSLSRSEKNSHTKINAPGIKRIIPNLPCICFRLPRFFFTHQIKNQDTVMLFMHPWEFIDMSKRGIRFDRYFNTGDYAINALRKWIHYFKKNNYAFLKCEDVSNFSPSKK